MKINKIKLENSFKNKLKSGKSQLVLTDSFYRRYQYVQRI